MSNEKKPPYVKVKGIPDEYEFVRNQKCDNCGKLGTYQRETQKLVESMEGYFDILECVCTECGHEKDFLFDINDFFKGT